MGVCVLTNSEQGSQIITKIASTALRKTLEAKTGHTAPPETTPNQLPTITLTPNELQQYKGYYALRFGGSGLGMFVIESKGGTCYLRGGGNKNGYKMQFHEGHWFSLPELSESLEPSDPSKSSKKIVYYKVTQINHQSVLLYKTAYSDQTILIGEKLVVQPLPKI